MRQVSLFSVTIVCFAISLLFFSSCSDSPTGSSPIPSTPNSSNQSSSDLSVADSGYALGSAEEFSCMNVEEVRIRFSDPGYIKNNEVGTFVKYIGMPPGEKKLRVWWDHENQPNQYQDISIGEGDRNPVSPGRYDFEALLEHTYRDIEGKTERKIRVELILIGNTGNCARNRNIVLAPPGLAAGPTGPPAPCGGGSCTAFITSTGHRGDSIGSLANADAICQTRAGAASLSGTFKAWLSDSTGSPSTRFTQATTPYVRTDGAQLAADWANLTDGNLDNPLRLDESGMVRPVSTWTGTAIDGTPLPNHCDNWSPSMAMVSGTRGLSNQTAATWTNAGTFGCAFSFALYCFQQ